MYTMLQFHTKISSAAFNLDPQSKTTTFCLVFCFNPSSMLECMYRRAEEFRSVTFFVATGRERREGSGQLGKCLGRKFSRYCLDTRESLLPSQNTAYQGKLGWIISTEVRARRRGYSTQHSERGERRDLGVGLDPELNK